MSSINNNFITSLRYEVNKYFSQNQIKKKANLNMYLKCILMLSIYVTPYCLMVLGYVDNSLFWLCWLLMGFGMAGVGMCIMHDGNHNAFSNNRNINKIMGFTLQLLGGTYKNWKIQHNQLHHKYPNVIHHDPDVSPIKLLRFSPDSDYKKIYRFQFIYAWFLYGLMTFSFATIKEFKQLIEWSRNKIITTDQFRQLMLELIGWKTMYYFFILFIPIIVLNISFLEWFGLFFLMHFVAGFLLAIVFQTAHIMPDCKHLAYSEKLDLNTWAVNQLLTTSNYSPNNKVFSWLIGGLNYQIEHHLFPGICHVHYEKLSPIVKRVANDYNLPYHYKENFLQAIIAHGKMLYYLGQMQK
ncbi:MAG: acyl-CoA desaturase [Flavobacteriales bacterium]|nr:acyl-CoA desaturase [Flavobacteriales bacterium]